MALSIVTRIQSYRRITVSVLLVLAAPPAILAVLLALRLAPMAPALATSYIEIGLALIPGLVGIWRLSLRLSDRLLAFLIYIPVMSVALILWGLLFMCGALEACL